MTRLLKQRPAEPPASTSGGPINKVIGAQLRARRNELGLTQKRLADQVGVSQQQVLKYEQGEGRIPVDRLMSLCRFLKIGPETLFRPLDRVPLGMDGFAEPPQADFGIEAFADRDIVSLVRAFQKISDKAVRRKVLSLVQTVADERPPPRSPPRRARS